MLLTLVLFLVRLREVESQECDNTLSQGICLNENFTDYRYLSLSQNFFNLLHSVDIYFLVDTNIYSAKPQLQLDAFNTDVVNFVAELPLKIGTIFNSSTSFRQLAVLAFNYSGTFDVVANVSNYGATQCALNGFKGEVQANLNITNNNEPVDEKLTDALEKFNSFLKNDLTYKVLWVLTDARATRYAERFNDVANAIKEKQTAIYTVSLGACPFGYFSDKIYQYAMHNLSTERRGYSACFDSWKSSILSAFSDRCKECSCYPTITALTTTSTTATTQATVIIVACVVCGGVLLLVLVITLLVIICRKKKCCTNKQTAMDSQKDCDEVYIYPMSEWKQHVECKATELSLTSLTISSIDDDQAIQSSNENILQPEDVNKVKELFQRKRSITTNNAPRLVANIYEFQIIERDENNVKGTGFSSAGNYQSPATLIASRNKKWLVIAVSSAAIDKTMQHRIQKEINEILNSLD